MKSLEELYRIAQQQNITVDLFPLEKREALSLMDLTGECYIAIDPGKIRSEADERTKLSHELGHCITGAFYNAYSNFDCRQKHENRADKWAVLDLISADALDDAVTRAREGNLSEEGLLFSGTVGEYDYTLRCDSQSGIPAQLDVPALALRLTFSDFEIH